MHNLLTITIYTFIIYEYSIKEKTLNNECNILALYCASRPRSSLVTWCRSDLTSRWRDKV